MCALQAFLVALLLLVCSACRSTWYDLSYAPVPQEARVADAGIPGSQVRALVSINGVRRAKGDDPVRVEGRLRVENLGSTQATLQREGLELVTADLQGVFAGSIQPEDQRTLDPGETRVFDLRFPLPDRRTPDDYNFEGVAIKWAIDFGGGVGVPTSASFQRVRGYRDDPFLRPSFGVGVGVGYVHN
jgi:hypothetical protein